ncbi:MAG: [Fe-Fe] hydrogenase large subunit C-terminal domain-containing protein [Bacillota bacterium]
MKNTYSVYLVEEDCEGCTNCVKNCPTKAIRVHQGRAWIKEEYCIDCAACIRNCEYHAKQTKTTKPQEALDENYNIALIPPSFYAQIPPEITPNILKHKLLNMGFAGVINVSVGAVVYSTYVSHLLENKENTTDPLISSACPVVLRYIRLLYPELLDLVIKYDSPLEIAASLIKEKLSENYAEDDIKLYFITPCPAKHTAVYYPPGKKSSYLTGAISVSDIINSLREASDTVDKLQIQSELDEIEDSLPVMTALAWGKTGGESCLNNLPQKNIINIDGLQRIEPVLAEISRNNFSDVDYLELTACPGGCLGGVLNIVNPFQGMINLENYIKDNDNTSGKNYSDLASKKYLINTFKQPEVMPDENKAGTFQSALARWQALEEEKELLPGLDCAACGAPDCETLAEDIVDDYAERTDCIFMLRQEIESLAGRMSELVSALPPAMGRNIKEEDQTE